jgi:uncharacterized protein YkwD
MNLDRVLGSARKFLTTTLVTVVTAAGLTAAAPSNATATAATPPVARFASAKVSAAYSDTYEQGVQHWVNQVRKQHHLRPLSIAGCTDSVAERWSSHLAATNGFYHQSMTRLLSKCHARYAGETLGRGAITPRHLVTMWMHSPPHRAVLMSKSPTRIGIGATPSAGQWVVAANFMRL